VRSASGFTCPIMPSPAQPIERKLAAIFAADVAGCSRLMGQDEVGTLRTLAAHREIMDRLIGEHRGRIANTAGDSVLAEFPSVVDAVQCAVEVQQALAEANEGVPEERRMRCRIGVHVGDVMVRGADLSIAAYTISMLGGLHQRQSRSRVPEEWDGRAGISNTPRRRCWSPPDDSFLPLVGRQSHILLRRAARRFDDRVKDRLEL
jgi:hypothetical protein